MNENDSTVKKTLPSLQSRLNFTGSDEQFKKYLNIALSNRGDVWRDVFEMYYGINRVRCSPQKIYEQFGISTYTQSKIRKNVMERIEEEISQLIALDLKTDSNSL